MPADHDPPHDEDRRVYFVLGMHRSGTSCLTACLEQAGAHVGAVERFSPHQPRGNLEQAAAMRLNDAILEAAGGAWDSPPDGEVVPTPDQRAEIAAIVAQLEAHAPGALKDPRVLFTLDAWTAAARQPRLVGTFRHPGAVAASLRERDGTPAAEAYELWRRYNERLVRLHDELGFPLIEFDLADHDRYCRVVEAVAAELGLVPDPDAIRGVVESVGNSGGPGEVMVPADCTAIYDYLRDHRYRGEVAPGTPAERLTSRGTTQGAPASMSGRDAIARRMWIAARSLPRPLRVVFRPVQRNVIRVLRRLPSRAR